VKKRRLNFSNIIDRYVLRNANWSDVVARISDSITFQKVAPPINGTDGRTDGSNP